MRLNVEQVRNRIEAVVQGRDDRLVVLLRCEFTCLLQQDLLHWIRSLARDYDDDLEILIHASYVPREWGDDRANGNWVYRPYELARFLQRFELPVAFATSDTQLDERLAAVTAWTIRWSFDMEREETGGERIVASLGQIDPLRTGEPGDRANGVVRTVAAIRGGLLPGIVVPPGVVYGLRAQAGEDCSPIGREGMLVDMTWRPRQSAHGQELARSIGEVIQGDTTCFVGALLDATLGSTAPHVPTLLPCEGRYQQAMCNVDAVEATLDVLANAVRQRRVSMATRSRRSLWHRL